MRSQLEPLVPGQHLSIEGPSIEGPGDRVAEVRDLGPRYEVRVASAVRTLDDPRRDCLERARAAAVIISLGLRSGLPTDPRSDSQTGADPERGDVAVEAERQTVLGIQLLASLEHPVGSVRSVSSGLAPGAAVGVALVRAPWRLGLGAGFVAPAILDDAGEAEGFQMLRLPATLTGAYLWDLGVVQLGPGLGAIVEAVQLRGVNTPGATGGWRWNVGAVGTLATHWSLGSGWAAILGLRGTAFPKTYEAWVEPDRSLGTTPRWWVGTFLGIEHVLEPGNGSR